jgi:glutamine amidotransferase
MGNVSSIGIALLRRDIFSRVVQKKEDLGSQVVILPGVGHFSTGSIALDRTGLRDGILRHVSSGGKLIGICLGMQLLGHSSEEGEGRGLGIFDFSSCRVSKQGSSTAPLMGWKTPLVLSNGWLGLSGNERYFFCHDYGILDTTRSFARLCHSHGGEDIVSAVEQENVIGFQFHPERSHNFGHDILSRAVRELSR